MDEPPAAGWDRRGRNYLTAGWWLGVFPGLAILAVVFGIDLVGDWLRDLLAPASSAGCEAVIAGGHALRAERSCQRRSLSSMVDPRTGQSSGPC